MIRRIVGCGAVVVTAFVSYAVAGLTFTPPSVDASHPVSTGNAQVIFSVRNTGSASVMITAAPVAPCTFAVTDITPPSMFPANVGPNQQIEVQVATSGLADNSVDDCTVHVSIGSGSGPDEVVEFQVHSATATIDLEPTQLDFGTRATGNPEEQLVSFYNYTGAMISPVGAIIGDSTSSYVFSGGCMSGSGSGTFVPPASGHNCTIPPVLANGSGLLGVTCNPSPTASGLLSATLQVTLASVTQLVPLTCNVNGSGSGGIQIDEAPNLTISGPEMTDLFGTAHVSATGSGSQQLMNANLAGSDATRFTFVNDANCANQSCLWMPGVKSTPASLDIKCHPNTLETFSTTLTVHGQTMADVAQSTVTCTGTTTGSAILDVSPAQLTYPSTQFVGEAQQQTMSAGDGSNAGQAITGIQLSAGNNSGDYKVSSCLAPASCGPFNAGSGTDIQITFTPSTYGDRSTSILVNSTNGGQTTVPVAASGSGGQLINLGANPIHFGTIAKGQLQQRPIVVRDDGNMSLAPTLTLTQPGGGPFALTANQIALFALGSGSANVTCGSDTPTAQVAGSVQVTATGSGVFGTSDYPIPVDCTIADTNVQIVEGAVDFGLVRSDAGMKSQVLTIKNASLTDPGTVHSVSLSLSPPSVHVSLKQPTPSEVTLGPGSSVTVEVDLDPAAGGSDEDFEMEALAVDVSVDSTSLSAPVHQGVVHADSTIAPNPLDLGTACVGSTGSGAIVITNTGTATIDVMQPIMDLPFSAQLQGTSTTLLPMQTATTFVTPSPQATGGMLTGTLHWDDTANPHTVPVTLNYVTSGTALSPTQLSFPTTQIGAITDNQTAALNNCDDVPHDITIHPVSATQGSPGAWHVTPAPSDTSQQLGGRGMLAILIQFAPLVPGHYQATLPIEDDTGTITNIQLSADATGTLDNTSFYACGCSGPEAPVNGWPLGIALVAILRRRARR